MQLWRFDSAHFQEDGSDGLAPKKLVLWSLIAFLLLELSTALAQTNSAAGLPHPITPTPSFKEAARLFAGGNFDEALVLVRKSLEQSPHSVEGLNLLGMIYNEQGKYDQAISQFQKALAFAPNSVDTLVNLATTYANER